MLFICSLLFFQTVQNKSENVGATESKTLEKIDREKKSSAFHRRYKLVHAQNILQITIVYPVSIDNHYEIFDQFFILLLKIPNTHNTNEK